jgi:DNA-binding NarL/FixJ family response regulator
VVWQAPWSGALRQAILGHVWRCRNVSPVSVLIVDDHESYLRVARSVVEAAEGFTVVGTAGSGEESIEVVERLRPDLVLMDVNLPGIDGVEATRRLRALSRSPVVVLLSTYDEGDVDPPVERCGAVTYVAKSAFGPDRLAAAWAVATGD